VNKLVKNFQYRPEIDGLRAIAVLAVIFYHAGLDRLSGGFAGVDIFFVISGFLITNIIYQGLINKSFSTLFFYERRIRRLLPALFVMIIIILPLMFLVLVPYQIKDLSQSILASLVYLSNVLFYFEGGYFAVEASQKPLLHTWSLAIEEQYYLIFPWVLMLIYRLPFIKIITLLGIVSLGSFLAMTLQENSEGSASFYLIQYRAWELLAGSMAAILAFNRPQVENSVYSYTGLALILISLFITTNSHTWPNPSTLVPVLGTVLILLFSSGNNFVGKILSHKVPRQLGLMSYSLYLWHFPLFVALNALFLGDPSWSWILGCLGLTLLLGFLSWRYIEIPFRNVEVISRATLIGSLSAMMIVMVLFSYAGLKSQGFFDIKVGLVNLAWREKIIDRENEIKLREVLLNSLEEAAHKPYLDEETKNILVLGDSLSEDIFMAASVNQILFPKSEFRRFSLDDVCMSYLAESFADTLPKKTVLGHCQLEIDILKNSGILANTDEIVLAAGWQTDTYLNGIQLAKYFAQQDIEMSVVGIAAFNDMTSLSMILSRMNGPIEKFLYDNLREKFLIINRELRIAVSFVETLKFLDKLSLFCDVQKEECQMLDREGNLPIFDASHLTVPGLNLYAEKMHIYKWFD